MIIAGKTINSQLLLYPVPTHYYIGQRRKMFGKPMLQHHLNI